MRIVNFGEVVSLDGGMHLSHQFTVELPAGDRVQVKTNEGTVQQLLDALTGKVSSPPLDPAYDVGTTVDTGDTDWPAEDVGELSLDEAVMGTVAEEPVTVSEAPTRGIGQQAAKPPVDADGFYKPPTAKTVPKDELGYPIVRSTAGASNYSDNDLDDEDEDDGTQI